MWDQGLTGSKEKLGLL